MDARGVPPSAAISAWTSTELDPRLPRRAAPRVSRMQRRAWPRTWDGMSSSAKEATCSAKCRVTLVMVASASGSREEVSMQVAISLC